VSDLPIATEQAVSCIKQYMIWQCGMGELLESWEPMREPLNPNRSLYADASPVGRNCAVTDLRLKELSRISQVDRLMMTLLRTPLRL
jgi:hypothetical protein